VCRDRGEARGHRREGVVSIYHCRLDLHRPETEGRHEATGGRARGGGGMEERGDREGRGRGRECICLCHSTVEDKIFSLTIAATVHEANFHMPLLFCLLLLDLALAACILRKCSSADVRTQGKNRTLPPRGHSIYHEFTRSYPFSPALPPTTFPSQYLTACCPAVVSPRRGQAAPHCGSSPCAGSTMSPVPACQGRAGEPRWLVGRRLAVR
jgi:hypothetical protein